MKKLSLYLIILSIFVVLPGCSVEIDGDIFDKYDFDDNAQTIETGELRTYSKSYDLEGQKSLDVDIEINAAKVNLKKTENKLFEGNIETNIIQMTPNIKLDGSNLYIGDEYESIKIKSFKNTKNAWDLKLTDKIPLDLAIKMNACKNNFDLTDMIIDKISLELNATDNKISFNSINKGKFKNFYIDLNAGSLQAEGLGYAGVSNIDATVNAGNIELKFDENIRNDISIKIESNASNSTIILPKDIGFKVELEKNLSNVNIKNFDYSNPEKNVYISDNYDVAKYKVKIEIEGNISNLDIKGL